MIQITAHMRILVAVEPVDFRKGIDGLCRLCLDTLHSDPFSGTLFVFVNRSGQMLRVLAYDGQGFWLCHKRLSKGRFVWPFAAAKGPNHTLAARQLQLLLWNTDPFCIPRERMFRKIPQKNIAFL